MEAYEADGRSREGAWIEINLQYVTAKKATGRSREGAWIEIFCNLLVVAE